MLKKSVCVTLVFIMLLSIMPIYALASETDEQRIAEVIHLYNIAKTAATEDTSISSVISAKYGICGRKDDDYYIINCCYKIIVPKGFVVELSPHLFPLPWRQ